MLIPSPGSGRIAATSADGFDFIGARCGPLIENNFFDHLQDDNIVISLRGNEIKSHEGNHVQLTGQSGTWYEPGDTVEVVSPLEGVPHDYKIVSMPPQTNLWQPPMLTLDRPLEGTIVNAGGDYPTLVHNKSWRLDGTIIRHNTFQNTRRYAVFMGAGGVTIEDNTMSNFTDAALLLSYTENIKTGRGKINYYPSTNIVVKNNKIANAVNFGEEGRVFDGSPRGAIDLYDAPRNTLGFGDIHLARDITIEDNTITDCGNAGIHIANASNVSITGNTVINPNMRSQSKRYGIWLESVINPQVSNNAVQGAAVDTPVQIEP